MASPSRADDVQTLQAMVSGARGNCPPLQLDPVLTGVAQRANRETGQYKDHNARFEPFEDPMPVLRDLGYPASKAKMLPGAGTDESVARLAVTHESAAMTGVVLFGWEAIPDCSYTKYGVDVLSAPTYALAMAILAAP